MPEINEHNRVSELAAGRRADRGVMAESARSAADEPRRLAPALSSGSVNSVVWLLLFAAAGIITLISAGLNLISGIAGFVLNYSVVFMLWIWAKGRGLKPPTFTSNLKKGAAVASKASEVASVSSGAATGGTGGALESAESAMPGNDLLFIGLGGISPALYVFGLWMNNG